jgi:hypothetical protein
LWDEAGVLETGVAFVGCGSVPKTDLWVLRGIPPPAAALDFAGVASGMGRAGVDLSRDRDGVLAAPRALGCLIVDVVSLLSAVLAGRAVPLRLDISRAAVSSSVVEATFSLRV